MKHDRKMQDLMWTINEKYCQDQRRALVFDPKLYDRALAAVGVSKLVFLLRASKDIAHGAEEAKMVWPSVRALLHASSEATEVVLGLFCQNEDHAALLRRHADTLQHVLPPFVDLPHTPSKPPEPPIYQPTAPSVVSAFCGPPPFCMSAERQACLGMYAAIVDLMHDLTARQRVDVIVYIFFAVDSLHMEVTGSCGEWTLKVAKEVIYFPIHTHTDCEDDFGYGRNLLW